MFFKNIIPRIVHNRVSPAKTKSPTQTIGNWAEHIALNYLTKHGFRVLAKQFRCKLGEVDLIMQSNQLIIFVEVRFRSKVSFVTPEESIGYRKQQRIIRTALLYYQKNYKKIINQNNIQDLQMRFDVIAITGNKSNYSLNWVKDAFEGNM